MSHSWRRITVSCQHTLQSQESLQSHFWQQIVLYIRSDNWTSSENIESNLFFFTEQKLFTVASLRAYRNIVCNHKKQLLARRPETLSRILSRIQRAVQTVLGVYLKRTCSRVTSASSALGDQRQRSSDSGIQRPGDPVDPVTLFCNQLKMSTYVWRSILRPKNL